MFESIIYSDIVRFMHIGAVSLGVGTAIITELFILSNLTLPVSDHFVTTVRKYHRNILLALVGLWITGLLLIGLRTGFSVENFTPKLHSKLFIVILLTSNAVLIDRIFLPFLQSAQGRILLVLSARRLVPMAAIAGISSASWFLALAMGISKTLAASGPEMLIALIAATYFSAITFSICTLCALRYYFFRSGKHSFLLRLDADSSQA